MTRFAKFSLRFGIYLVVLLYLIGDLVVFKGPLSHKLEKYRPDSPYSRADAQARGVVARVFHYEITRGQLDFALQQLLWLEGKSSENLSAEQLHWLRYAALGELIQHNLLRLKASVNALDLPRDEPAQQARLIEFSHRFDSGSDLADALQAHGFSSTDLPDRIAACLQQEAFVKSRIAKLVEVTDAEIEAWLNDHPDPPFSTEETKLAMENLHRHAAVKQFQETLRQYEARYIVLFHEEITRD